MCYILNSKATNAWDIFNNYCAKAAGYVFVTIEMCIFCHWQQKLCWAILPFETYLALSTYNAEFVTQAVAYSEPDRGGILYFCSASGHWFSSHHFGFASIVKSCLCGKYTTYNAFQLTKHRLGERQPKQSLNQPSLYLWTIKFQ